MGSTQPPSRARRICRWILGILAGLLLAVAVFVASEWTWFRRMATYPGSPITDVEWYEPREVVLGPT